MYVCTSLQVPIKIVYHIKCTCSMTSIGNHTLALLRMQASNRRFLLMDGALAWAGEA